MISRKFIVFFGLSLILFILGIFPFQSIQADQGLPSSCLVYFTGVGCPHCAQADPVVLEEALTKHPGLVVIEYEIYQEPSNAKILREYNETYKLPAWRQGVPTLFINQEKVGIFVGDGEILGELKNKIPDNQNQCLLADGSSATFSQLNLNQLPGYPKVWCQDKILIKEKEGKWIFAWNGKTVPEKHLTLDNSADVLSTLIEAEDPSQILLSLPYNSLPNDLRVALSGRGVTFHYAVRLATKKSVPILPLSQKITFAKVVSLAGVDAINPCALAVLLLMLTTIMAGNTSRGKKSIFLGGLAFIVAVFVIYFIYGLVIIRFFQVAQLLAPIKIWLYRILGSLAILLGLSNIKDFFFYKPGGMGTEMPLFLRPKAKKLITGVTSPIGAFVAGALVTVFLLPCTIGPYFIAGGILSAMDILKTIPWLLLYNLIFVLPMVAIVLLVCGGLNQVKDISQWKEKNITKIHLVEGFIMLGLGVIMILGIF